MDSEITSGARLIGVNKVTLNDLAKRGIVVRGERKGTYLVEPSVASYCQQGETLKMWLMAALRVKTRRRTG
jgi:DNA-binding GntR family transcriptional regulator